MTLPQKKRPTAIDAKQSLCECNRFLHSKPNTALNTHEGGNKPTNETLSIIWILGFLALLGLAFIPAKIASEKGYSFGLFYLLGIFCWIPSLIVTLVIQDKNSPCTKAAKATENVDLLLKYKQLLDTKVITQAEFDAKKNELIDEHLNALPIETVDSTRRPNTHHPSSIDRSRTIQLLALCASGIGLFELIAFLLLAGESPAVFFKFLMSPLSYWISGYPVPQPFFFSNLCSILAGFCFIAFNSKKEKALFRAGIATCALAGIFAVISAVVTIVEATSGFVEFNFLLMRTVFSIPALIACSMGALAFLETREQQHP